MPIFNFSRKKVGGIWFFKLGRLNFSFCVSRSFVELVHEPSRHAVALRSLPSPLAFEDPPRVVRVNSCRYLTR